jgi:hypothetical protein
LKNNLRIVLFLIFVCWCVDATKINTIFEFSETCQSSPVDSFEDEKQKDFEVKYNSKIKNIVFLPFFAGMSDLNYCTGILFIHNVCLEVNAPPPDNQA